MLQAACYLRYLIIPEAIKYFIKQFEATHIWRHVSGLDGLITAEGKPAVRVGSRKLDWTTASSMNYPT